MHLEENENVADTKLVEMESANTAELFPHDILVVEDNRTNQKIISQLLSKLGYECDIASRGKEAIERFNQSNAYTIILMDIDMPDMDGFETTRRLIQNLGERLPPVVAVSAHAFKQDVEYASSAGMVDHIAKPIKLSRLKNVLIEHHPSSKKP